MTNEKTEGRGQYGDVVARLAQIVEALEGGQLTLEQSLDKFAEGVQLVKQGERLLSDAEKRIEQLLSEDGRVVPLKVPEEGQRGAPTATPAAATPMKRPPRRNEEDDDIPF